MDNLRAAIQQAKKNAQERDNDVKKKEEARLYKEASVIAQAISTANAQGYRSTVIEGQISVQVRDILMKEGCKVVVEERGYNPSTHDPMVVGWRISW